MTRLVNITGDGTYLRTTVEVEGMVLKGVRRVTFDLEAGERPTVTIVLNDATVNLRGVEVEPA